MALRHCAPPSGKNLNARISSSRVEFLAFRAAFSSANLCASSSKRSKDTAACCCACAASAKASWQAACLAAAPAPFQHRLATTCASNTSPWRFLVRAPQPHTHGPHIGAMAMPTGLTARRTNHATSPKPRLAAHGALLLATHRCYGNAHRHDDLT